MAVPLCACITYHDARPVAQQQADLNSAAAVLAGTYEVVDSRHDDYHLTGVVARKAYGSEGLDVKLTSSTAGSGILPGKKCHGWVANNYASVQCDSIYGVNFFRLDSPTKSDRVVEDGAVIGKFAPMTVPAGDHLLTYVESGNGRIHYYVLSKKTAQ